MAVVLSAWLDQAPLANVNRYSDLIVLYPASHVQGSEHYSGRFFPPYSLKHGDTTEIISMRFRHCLCIE
jgi:hypothetical protein